MSVAHLQAKSSNEIQSFLDGNGKLAVVQIGATWCGHCIDNAPYVKQKSDQTKIPLISIDVDQAPDLFKAYAPPALPTYLAVQNTWDNVIFKATGGNHPNIDGAFGAATFLKW